MIQFIAKHQTNTKPTFKPTAKPTKTPIAKPAKLAKPAMQAAKTPTAKLVAKIATKSTLKDDSTVLEINPFLTFDMVSNTTGVTFFSKFNAALALSNLDTPKTPRQAAVNNPAYFFPALSDCVNKIYGPGNDYKPLFNSRYIYGFFSNHGATLELYKDIARTEEIGTFTLPSPQSGEYISKLLWNTDAHVPLSNLSKNIDSTKKEKVDPNGNIRYWLTFDKGIAQSTNLVTIKLINPNDNAYKELSQITDFTGLAFTDTNNKSVQISLPIAAKLKTIYSYKDNPAANVPPISPYKSTDDPNIVLAVQAFTLAADGSYGSTDSYSYGYNPAIQFIYYNNQIEMILCWNVFHLTIGADESTATTQELAHIEYQTLQTEELKNIAKITANSKAILLNAPLLPIQVLFNFCFKFDPIGGNPITNVPAQPIYDYNYNKIYFYWQPS